MRTPASLFDLAIALVLAAAVFVCHPVSYVFHHPFWLDEAWVATLAKAPAGRAYALASSTPIGWLFLLRLVPGGRGEQLRIVPLVFAAGEVAAAYGIGRCLPWGSRLFARVAGAAVGLVVLLAPVSLIRNDLKQYTADAFFALVILGLASRAEGAAGARETVEFAAACIVAMFFSTTAAFVALAAVAGLVGASLASRSRERIRTVLLGGLCVTTALGIYFALVVIPHTSTSLRHYWDDFYLPSSPLRALAEAWHRFDLVAPALAMPAVVAVALFVAGCATFVRLGRPALAGTLAVLWIELLVVGMARRYPFLDLRTSQFLLVVSLVPIAVGFLGAVHELLSRGRLAIIAIAVVVAALYLHGVTPYLRARLIPREDVRGATEYVARERRPGDVVVVSVPSTFGFSYYWHGSHIQYLDDGGVSMGFVTRVRGLRNVVYAGGLAPSDTTRAMQRALREAGAGSRIWVVRTHLFPDEAKAWASAFRFLHLRPVSKRIGDEAIWIVTDRSRRS